MQAHLPVVSTNVPTISDLRGIERGYHYVRFVLPPLPRFTLPSIQRRLSSPPSFVK
nr:MAG TPA: hypothetical protein [Caudoviricetes sp.]